MGRERFPKQSLGALYNRVKQARILMVGAGGIGCELLKNLVLTGFGEIHIVDLDTIDLSNLNRQFLFRQEHIKKSKALVAKESAGRSNPHVKLEAHHANIKDPQFNIDWFQDFNIVFNALDNLDARRHVNKMCLAAGVPLIESGTTGFNGQVQVIIKNSEIFGTSEDEAPEFDHSQDTENAQEIENLRKESQALNKIRQSMGSAEFARLVFEKVFTDDINRLRSMEDMWKTRRPPNPLNFDELVASAASINPSISQQDQKIWTQGENFAVFLDSIRRLTIRLQQAQKQSIPDAVPPVLTFDKDDEDTLDFVAASANLRSSIFDIEPRSKFDIKQMAGNIIPAIATTNAMTAGLCVLQAFKVMREDINKAKMIFLERSGARVINSDSLKPPNPNCNVCGVMQSRLLIDPARATLNNLVQDILKSQLGYGEEFTINNEVGILYDSDLEDNLGKKFSDLGVKADSFLTVVDDDDENSRVNLSLSISEQSLPEDTKPVQLPGNLEIARKPKIEPVPVVNGDANGHVETNGAGMKRKRELEEGDDAAQQDAKRGKMQKNIKAEAYHGDDVIIGDDDHGDGAIVIDD
ncbi:E1 ubiquitin-activating protein uba2 [Lecanora helva]